MSIFSASTSNADFERMIQKRSMSIRTITPELAREMLRSQVRNRTRRIARENMYLRAMCEGRWRDPDMLWPIVVDSQGRLLEGQHRLGALIQHGKARNFCIMVATLEEVDVKNETLARTHSDRLTIVDGVPNATVYVAVSKLIRHVMGGKPIKVYASPGESTYSTEELRDAIEATVDAGIDFAAAATAAKTLWNSQPRKLRILTPTSIAYALVDARNDPAMLAHVERIILDRHHDATPAEVALRNRALNDALRWREAMYALIHSYNSPELRQIKIPPNAVVPNVKGGFFEWYATKNAIESIPTVGLTSAGRKEVAA